MPKDIAAEKAVYIGRFQPITKTHRRVVQYIEEQKDIEEIVIIKGGTQWNDKNPDPSAPSKNPFTADECCEMINLSLNGRIKKPYRIIKVPDTSTKFTDFYWQEWVGSIVNAIGSKDFVVFTNAQREITAFGKAGINCKPFYVDKGTRATIVREAIANRPKDEWQVDKEVADYLEKINASGRIKRILDLFP